MENLKGSNCKSVPQFGAWEHQAAGFQTNYSMVFSQARANRKKHQIELTHHSFGNELELLRKMDQYDESPVIHAKKKKKRLGCLSCCIRP